jgi:hypothetical protein
MELRGALVSELVSSAWCGATGFGSLGYQPHVSVVRWWLEVAAGGGEIGVGGYVDVMAATLDWWTWRGAPWRVVPR